MIGKTLGRYRIVEKLGQGGMGEVWRAEDPVLGRSVALKILPKEFTSLPDARARFLREARAASGLHHSGIAAVFDAGEEKESLYIAFELIKGDSIADRSEQEGQFEVLETLRIGEQAARALHHAHEQGVIHRDVTAGNLMVEPGGRVVLVDFGLALPEGATRFTVTGGAVGTASYMAPEVGLGEAGDARSDIYGLGAVLYHMLVGRPPFVGSRPHAVLLAAINEPVEPLGAFRADVPRALQDIVLRCLAKDPDERYQNARSLARDLGRLRSEITEALGEAAGRADIRTTARISSGATDAVLESLVGTVHSLGKRVRTAAFIPTRFPRWAELGLSVMTFLALVGLFRTVDPFQWWSIAGKYSSLAVLPLVNESIVPGDGDYLNLGLGQGLAARLSRISGIRVPSWQSSRGHPQDSAPLNVIARELGVELLLVGSFSKREDQLWVVMALMDTASTEPVWGPVEFRKSVEDFLDMETAMARKIARALESDLSEFDLRQVSTSPTKDSRAYDLFLRGMDVYQEGTERAIDSAIEYQKRVLDRDPRLAVAHLALGAAILERYYRSLEGGGENLGKAKASFNTALALEPGMTDARRGLIHLLYYEGRIREILKLAVEDSSRSAETLLVRAEAYHFGGLPSKAVPLFEEILRLEPTNPAAAFYLVISLGWSGQHEKAIEAGNSFLREHGGKSEVHWIMGEAFLELGDLERARLHFEHADSPLHLGGFLLETGEDEEAARVLQSGLNDLIQRLAAYSDNPKTRAGKALHHALLGDHVAFQAEAERLLRENPENEYIRAQLTQGYAKLSDYAEAEKLIRESMARGEVLERLFSLEHGSMSLEDLTLAPRYKDLRSEYENMLQKAREEF